jgi:broad specificity phosphatase PhoE
MLIRKINKYMSEPKVFLIRHGSTDLNGESGQSVDKIRGWIDVPLNDKGRADAEDAKKKLKKEHPKKIYSSDLIRAHETAAIIDEDFNIPLETSKSLRPWNLGDYQGKETSKILGELNDLIKHEDKSVKNGESFKEFRVRYLSLMKQIVDQAKKEHCTIFVVAHFRNLKCCDAWVENGMPNDLSIAVEYMLNDKFKPGEIYEIPIK